MDGFGHTDIYPTVLDLVGVKARDGVPVDGQSILPLLKGETMEHQPNPSELLLGRSTTSK